MKQHKCDGCLNFNPEKICEKRKHDMSCYETYDTVQHTISPSAHKLFTELERGDELFQWEFKRGKNSFPTMTFNKIDIRRIDKCKDGSINVLGDRLATYLLRYSESSFYAWWCETNNSICAFSTYMSTPDEILNDALCCIQADLAEIGNLKKCDNLCHK